MSEFKSTIIVTGGTTGLGYWAAYETALRSPNTKIIIASRSDKENSARSLNELLIRKNKHSAEEQVEFRPLDLESLSNVRSFAEIFHSGKHPPISALLLNAGLQFHKGDSLRQSPEGIESTFAINQVGHSLLFFLLKPCLTQDARIIITASGTHDPAQKTMVPDAKYETAELLAHPTDPGYENMKGVQRYASTKLSNVIFGYALEKRLKAGRDAGHNNWTVAMMDPGLMPGTSLARDLGPVVAWIATHVLTKMLWLLKLLTRSSNVHLPQESGRNLATLATKKGSEAAATSGKYFEGDREIPSSAESYVLEKQEDLFSWSINFLAKDKHEIEQFSRF